MYIFTETPTQKLILKILTIQKLNSATNNSFICQEFIFQKLSRNKTITFKTWLQLCGIRCMQFSIAKVN